MLTYERAQGSEKLAVSLNLGREAQQISHAAATIILSTHLDRSGENIGGNLALRHAEGVVARLHS